MYIAGMDWHEICRKVHDEGLLTLSKGESLPFMVRAYDHNGSAAQRDLLLSNGLDDAARAVLRTTTRSIFSGIHLPAALVQSDARAVHGDKFAKYFGVSEKLSIREYEEEYSRILTEKFDGTVANLPQELWIDALVTCIKGPKIMPVNFMTFYEKNAKGKIEFEPAKEQPGAEINFLPDWWKNTIN